VNYELKIIWTEAVVAYFKVVNQDFHEGIEENHKKSQDSRSLSRNLNPGSLEYMLTIDYDLQSASHRGRPGSRPEQSIWDL
jgi:hypothetical protein